MIYSSWNIQCDKLKLELWVRFCPLTPPPPPPPPPPSQKKKPLKNQNFEKKWKKLQEISSFYRCAPKKHNHMRYGFWNTEWDRLLFSFRAIFCPFTLLTTHKINTFKKMKKAFWDVIALHMAAKNHKMY